MGANEPIDDLTLVRNVLAQDARAADVFVRRIADMVWRICRLLTRDEAEARDTFAIVFDGLRTGNFARLKAYDGRARLEVYIAAAARDLLAERTLASLYSDPREGWMLFEKLFASDIRRVIARRLPGPQREDTRADAYQEICAALIADNYRRLSSFHGAGSFSGFVLHMADRLLIDFIRSFSVRRRVPAAIARLSDLDREVFGLVYWRERAPEPRSLAAALEGVVPKPSAEDVALSLARVQTALPQGYAAGGARFVSLSETDADVAGHDASPEAALIGEDDERQIAAAADALKKVAADLPETDRIYLRIVLNSTEPLPAREIAQLMNRPVAEIYKLKQRVLKQLKAALEGHEAVKNWLASV